MAERYTLVGELQRLLRSMGLRFLPEPSQTRQPLQPSSTRAALAESPARSPEASDSWSLPQFEDIVPRAGVAGGHYIGLGAKRFPLGVVGESRRQNELKRLQKRLRKDQKNSGERLVFAALLVPEPDNPVDSDAVAVYAETSEQIGYLPAGEAAEIVDYLAALKKRGLTAYCEGAIFGGTKDKPSIGVWLSMVPPSEADDEYSI